jgi:chemotaxis protein methyltransferase CheR
MIPADMSVTVHDPEGQGRDSSLTTGEFKAIAQRVHERTGIVLGDSKRDLVQGRLGRRLRTLGCGSFREYIELLDGPDAEQEQVILINAITTNLTSFFREPHHFETLAKEVIPELAKAPRQGNQLRIWSAGCSSGEEPYTIAMTVQRALPSFSQ